LYRCDRSPRGGWAGLICVVWYEYNSAPVPVTVAITVAVPVHRILSCGGSAQ
jgi:hypothetical protein